jgi:[ribosomal protein S5]-alanine N-acetyltransferase
MEHANGPYLRWMNDPEVTRFLESRCVEYKSSHLEEYIQQCNENTLVLFLGIFDKLDGVHIGNIKLGPIEKRHRRSEVGIVVGDKSRWGRGIAKEAIRSLAEYAFSRLQLFKLTAGCYASNRGSIRAFIGAGWHSEACRKRHFQYQGRWEDAVLLARFRCEVNGEVSADIEIGSVKGDECQRD